MAPASSLHLQGVFMWHSSRRDFLKTGSWVTGGLLVAPLAQAAPSSHQKITWDEAFDVIVVGSGLAGLSAGITAAEAGSGTVILDKMMAHGGSSVISGGTFAACNTEAQKKAGIQDSVETFYNDLMKAGERLNVPELVRTLVENSADAHRFLVERGGLYDDRLRIVAGHSVTRCFQPAYNMGLDIIKPLFRHYVGLPKAQLRLKIKVDEVVRDVSGRAVGLKVREGYLFDAASASDDRTNQSGIVKYYKANKGIIFATGGFSRDTEFREFEFPQYRKIPSTVQLGATSGALKTLIRCGARPMHTALVRFAISIGYEDIEKGILLDQRTGKRFIGEGASRMGLSYKIVDLANAGSDWPALIYDSEGLKTIYDRDKLEIILNNGEMQKFDSLAQLANHFKMPSHEVEESIKKYNDMFRAGTDTEFGKDFKKTKSSPVEKGPFYACPVYPKFNYTQGGILIDRRARALDMENAVIPGLYVAGEAATGVHGAVRVTGCSTVDCTVFGRIAGREAHAMSQG